MNFYELFRRWAESTPSGIAVTYADRQIRYSELDELVRRCASGLRRAGVEPGDRVLMYAPNVPEHLVVYLACAYIGAVFAPANVGFRSRELRYICGNARPRVAVVHGEAAAAFAEYTHEADGAPESVFVVDAPAAEGETPNRAFEELLPDPISDEPVVPLPEADLLICYTSGTASAPKPVLHSHGSEIFNATCYAGVWEFEPEDKGLVCLPLAWVYGLSTACAALLASGAAIELLPRFHPVEVVGAIERARATVMFGAMTMYQKMLDVLLQEPSDLTSLRVAVNGGEPCTESAVRAFEAHTGCRLLQAYALSEARPILAVRPGDRTAPSQSCGTLVPGAEVRLVGDDGNPVAPGEPGEAQVRCPGMMTAYNGEPELTREKVTDDGWVRSDDILIANTDGYYFVVGRRTDMIIRSGVNIAPAEIESVLLAHRSVADAAVVGVPDPVSGEAVVAFVVPSGTPPIEDLELRGHLAQQLAKYKVPRDIFTLEELPRKSKRQT